MLNENYTLAEAVSNYVGNPEHYLRGILDHLRQCAEKHGNASVRIGVSGSGQYPYYRVVYSIGNVEYDFSAYKDSHQPFSPAKFRRSWSKESTTLAKAEKLLSAFVNSKGA